MTHTAQATSGLLLLQFKKRIPRVKSWWAPVWRGLLVERTGKHYHAMHGAVWLYLYLIVHADRKTGTLFRRISTIAEDMGVKPTTVRRWLGVLSQNNYIARTRTGRSLQISIERWKRLQPRQDR